MIKRVNEITTGIASVKEGRKEVVYIGMFFFFNLTLQQFLLTQEVLDNIKTQMKCVKLAIKCTNFKISTVLWQDT